MVCLFWAGMWLTSLWEPTIWARASQPVALGDHIWQNDICDKKKPNSPIASAPGARRLPGWNPSRDGSPPPAPQPGSGNPSGSAIGWGCGGGGGGGASTPRPAGQLRPGQTSLRDWGGDGD